MVLIVDEEADQSLAESDRLLHRLGEAGASIRRQLHPVIDDLDGVPLVAGERDLLVEAADLAVDAHPDEALVAELRELLAILPLPLEHDRGAHGDAATGPVEVGLLHDAVDRVALDHRIAAGTVRGPEPGVEEPEVIEDLGDRPDGGAGISGDRLLVDADRRAEPLDVLHPRPVEAPEVLARVGGEALHEATLSLATDDVVGQGGLPRAGETGDDDQPVPGDLEVDIPEVVLRGPADDDRGAHRINRPPASAPSRRRLRRGGRGGSAHLPPRASGRRASRPRPGSRSPGLPPPGPAALRPPHRAA